MTQRETVETTMGERLDPMPRAQAEVYAGVPIEWAWVPRVGVPDLVLRALRDRGIVETVWCTGGQQWRRLPSPPKVE